jgi:hypothetical protein
MKKILLLSLLILFGCSKDGDSSPTNSKDLIQTGPPPTLWVTFIKKVAPTQVFSWDEGYECGSCYDLDKNYAYIKNYSDESPYDEYPFSVFQGLHSTIDTLIVDVTDLDYFTGSANDWKPQTNSFFWDFRYVTNGVTTPDWPQYIGYLKLVGFNEFSQLGWRHSYNGNEFSPYGNNQESILYFSSNLDDEYINAISTKDLNRQYNQTTGEPIPIFKKVDLDISFDDWRYHNEIGYDNTEENRLLYAIGSEHTFGSNPVKGYIVKSIEIR